jgi:hypothetical protein
MEENAQQGRRRAIYSAAEGKMVLEYETHEEVLEMRKGNLLSAILVILMAVVFSMTAGFAGVLNAQQTQASSPAQQTVTYLADLATMGNTRPQCYVANLNDEADYLIELALLTVDCSGNETITGFPTDNVTTVTWNNQYTPDMYNGYINVDNAYATYNAAIGGYVYYFPVTAVGYGIGVDSWQAYYVNDRGDFNFVCVDPNAPDSGAVANISVEFYDSAPNPSANTSFASGAISVVHGNDDYDSIPGDTGRAWATPLDMVAAGTLASPSIITTYHKRPNSQDLTDIVDNSGAYHTPSGFDGWLYGVYYPGDTPGSYVLDKASMGIGYDDYTMQEEALVIFAIGCANELFDYFPTVISR